MDCEVFSISAATGKGIDELLGRTIALLDEIPPAPPLVENAPEEDVVYTLKDHNKETFEIYRAEDGAYVVEADFLDQLIHSVNFDDWDSVGYFQRRLKDAGIFKKLKEYV